jgi:phosphoglycolate phosphatase
VTGAFLFDLDGTLIDSRRSIAAACNHALTGSGRLALSEAIIAGFVGDGARHLLARAAELGPDEGAALDALLAEFVRFYAAHPIDGTTWMPGAPEVLGSLGAAKLGLVTNKARAVTEPILRALGVAERFAVVVAGGDGPLKPDPAPIEAAVRALGATPAETWVVGDGVQDVRAGKAAGCRTAAITGGFHDEARLRAEAPDLVLGSLADLAAATAGWRSPA